MAMFEIFSRFSLPTQVVFSGSVYNTNLHGQDTCGVYVLVCGFHTHFSTHLCVKFSLNICVPVVELASSRVKCINDFADCKNYVPFCIVARNDMFQLIVWGSPQN